MIGNEVFAKYQSYPFKLTKFDIDFQELEQQIESPLQQFLAHQAPTLKHLKLNYGSDISTTTLNFIFHKMTLESLTIYALPEDLQVFLEIPENTHLNKLKLGKKCFQRKNIEVLIRIYNNIRELELEKAKEYTLDDATLRMILHNLPRLKRLKLPILSSCATIESSTLEEIETRSVRNSLLICAQNLKKLTISNFVEETDYEEHEERDAFSLILCRAPNLECLIINTFCSITNRFLDLVKKFCPKLHTLKIHECMLSEDVKEEKIRIYFTQNNRLSGRVELIFDFAQA